ncbi:MAG TPA: dihydrolipoamide acetyltransferase family protein [Gemmatimonadaceae bacterium]|nr:dihydrolipoamide acetyltransferase family protein [Gemmatimonadaceae bacterium]
MATKVTMEALSPTMEEGRLVKWLKNEGDTIAKGDVLAEVETDKAVMELTARGDGVLRARLAAEGDTRPVGELLAVIGAKDEDIDALLAKVPAKAIKASEAPAPPAPPAKASPPAAPEPPATPATPAAAPVAAAATTSGNGGDRARSSPLARRLASERGLDVGALHGTGPGGRVIRRDIEAAATAAPSSAASAPARAASAPRTTAAGDFEDIPLTQIRKTIARRLAESNGPIPTFFLTADFDLTSVRELRTRMIALGDEFKISYNDIILKAVATALSQHPEVNAHWLGDRIRHHHRVHLGMAVAVEDGLITPIIADADQKRISEIARDSRELAKRARERKLAPEEYTGATATVSNLGMFGIDEFTAIINPPEVAIFAIGAVGELPVVVDGALAVRTRVRITMSCDHRAVDGATGARFMQTLRRLIENPLMLVF